MTFQTFLETKYPLYVNHEMKVNLTVSQLCELVEEWEKMTIEKIICSAVWYNDNVETYVHQPENIKLGYVVAGRRHHNCITINSMLAGLRNGEFNGEITQGFLTNTNRFVNRKEAYKIAFEANQIIGPNKGLSENLIGLTSEDLY